MTERSARRHREAPFRLSADEIHVWTVGLDIADWRDNLVPGRLSDDELQRAARSPFERERRRFAVCRATLRAILGRYLDTRPCELSLRYGPYGKPRLDSEHYGEPIRFNVSHSDELALIAVDRGRELGVDIERVRPLDGIDDIVARHFGPAERLAFSRVAPAARLSTFYRYWTLKEAYLKAGGVGMSRALNEVDVTGAGDHPMYLPDVFGTGATRCWTGRTLAPAPGYIAALVVEGWAGASVTTMIGGPLTLTRLTLPGVPRTVGSATASDG